MMKTDEALALVRNPWGRPEALVREAQLTVCERLEAAERERNEWKGVAENWKDSAAQFSHNADFYQGIVRQIGKVFGEEARTSDDGSVQDDVLSLKVPELVEALAAHVKMQDDLLERFLENSEECVELLLADGDAPNIIALTSELDSIADGIQSLPYPENSLAELKAQWQAEALESFAKDWPWGEFRPDPKDIRKYARQLRRQAEENNK